MANPRYMQQSRWTCNGTLHQIHVALISAASCQRLLRVLSNEVAHIELRTGSRICFSLGAGLFTPNSLVPMTIRFDLDQIDEDVVEVLAELASDIANWSLIPRPGDHGRYLDAFDHLFRNLMVVTRGSDPID